MIPMRKYLKPALEINAFDVEDVITASGPVGPQTVHTSAEPVVINPGALGGNLGAPIDFIELN